MSQFVNAVMIGVVAFLVLLGAFWYAVDDRARAAIEATSVSTSWGTTDASGTKLRVVVEFSNGGRTAATLQSVQHELIVAGDNVSGTAAGGGLYVPSSSLRSLTFNETLPPTFLEAWLLSAFSGEEESFMEVKGTAYFRAGRETLEVPFGARHDWTSHVARDAAASLNNCPEAAPICLDGGSGHWLDGKGAPTLALDVRVNNAGERTARIENASVRFLMAGVEVAQGAATQPLVLEATQSGDVPIEATFQPDAYDDWWALHVKACESSPLSMAVKFTRVIDPPPGEEPPPPETTIVTWHFVGGAFRTNFAC